MDFQAECFRGARDQGGKGLGLKRHGVTTVAVTTAQSSKTIKAQGLEADWLGSNPPCRLLNMGLSCDFLS